MEPKHKKFIENPKDFVKNFHKSKQHDHHKIKHKKPETILLEPEIELIKEKEKWFIKARTVFDNAEKTKRTVYAGKITCISLNDENNIFDFNKCSAYINAVGDYGGEVKFEIDGPGYYKVSVRTVTEKGETIQLIRYFYWDGKEKQNDKQTKGDLYKISEEELFRRLVIKGLIKQIKEYFEQIKLHIKTVKRAETEKARMLTILDELQNKIQKNISQHSDKKYEQITVQKINKEKYQETSKIREKTWR